MENTNNLKEIIGENKTNLTTRLVGYVETKYSKNDILYRQQLENPHFKYIGIIGKMAIESVYGYEDCSDNCGECPFFFDGTYYDICLNEDVIRNYINYKRK